MIKCRVKRGRPLKASRGKCKGESRTCHRPPRSTDSRSHQNEGTFSPCLVTRCFLCPDVVHRRVRSVRGIRRKRGGECRIDKRHEGRCCDNPGHRPRIAVMGSKKQKRPKIMLLPPYHCPSSRPCSRVVSISLFSVTAPSHIGVSRLASSLA